MRSTILSAAVVALVACAPGGPGPARTATPPATPTTPATAPAPIPTPSPTPAASPTPAEPASLSLRPVAEGLDQPLLLTAPADDPRLFVVERPGRVRIVADGRLLPEPFLDITELTRTDGERGLLGLAFHPDYASNGRFFVHYSGAADGDTRVASYRVSDDPDRAAPDSGEILLTVEQPAANHNGGTIAFGPDGYLWIGLGDGGGGGDTFGNGQDPHTLLGTLLRIDVDADNGYAIPPDNPFADGRDGAPEVWAYGLRNPYRFSFDAGSVHIGDVGQSRWEEVDIEPADAAGLNYGWPILEGTHCFRSDGCSTEGLTLPIVEYGHDGGVCGVIGGHVYRGPSMPGLHGTYFYGDLCAGWVRSFRYREGEAVDQRDRSAELGVSAAGGPYRLLSFGQDAAGEVYVLTAAGQVLRIVAG